MKAFDRALGTVDAGGDEGAYQRQVKRSPGRKAQHLQSQNDLSPVAAGTLQRTTVHGDDDRVRTGQTGHLSDFE